MLSRHYSILSKEDSPSQTNKNWLFRNRLQQEEKVRKNITEIFFVDLKIIEPNTNLYSCNINSLGPPLAIWRGNARPACPAVAMWRPWLTAHIWRAPPHGNINIEATQRDVPSNIVHSYLLTSQKSVLFLFYHPIKMKLASVVGWNRKHWPDLTQPILHKLTQFGNNAYGVKGWDFYCRNVFSQWMKHITCTKH